ncbi:helix-turn-helix transcriptional regulator [Streptomyces sp. NPDC006668]|uniref:helix-turn-helix domain-containing protein n=1 Tax=Streptomyces sp. NPDC006668 TaxID=3156903 RepID=UPI0033DE907B
MSARVRLAGRLIEGRVATGLSVRSLGREVNIHPSTLSRIEDAMRLPTAQQLEHIADVLKARGVELDLFLLHELREQAKNEKASAGSGSMTPWKDVPYVVEGQEKAYVVSETDEPEPTTVASVQELIERLNEVHVWGGAESLRILAARMNRYLAPYGVSKSTVGEMLKRPKIPPLDRYEAFLKVCGIKDIESWLLTWRRLKLRERRDQLGA